MAFKSSVVDALGSYVYCLVDPRDNRIFYVGKGRVLCVLLGGPEGQ